ncbi:integrase catalytic domain-containing protein [Trichonephila inaurata madagascariensis]|uniref:Integrase catalytic domain-containing protein n=1 Tax=Trichonephila inaurata madagascariensis TaxID=2747483 RepID=A0A8X7C7Q4_9ARAC|nr:integrase catalytic domain-containing protein [Trichonephila inaurata madagascariensis]
MSGIDGKFEFMRKEFTNNMIYTDVANPDYKVEITNVSLWLPHIKKKSRSKAQYLKYFLNPDSCQTIEWVAPRLRESNALNDINGTVYVKTTTEEIINIFVIPQYMDRENTADKNFMTLALTRCYIRVNDTMFPLLNYGVFQRRGIGFCQILFRFLKCSREYKEYRELMFDTRTSLFSDASTKAYGTAAYLRVTSSYKEILTSLVASKNRIAPLKTLTLPRLELMGALLSARLSSNILKALKLDIPFFFWTDSKITYFWVRGQPERFKPFIKNRIQEIQKLTSLSNWHHCPGIQNPADIVSRGVKISRLLNDTSWLQGPEWLRLPPEFWPESKNEDSPNSPDLEHRKSNDIVQHECIIEERKSLFNISKYRNLEKVLRLPRPLTSEELLEANRAAKILHRFIHLWSYQSTSLGTGV